MKVRWTGAAKRDRRAAVEYVGGFDPLAAARLDDLFKASTARLGDFPRSASPGAIAGTRELIPHPSYRLVYEVADDGSVLILALVHTSRQWPPVQP